MQVLVEVSDEDMGLLLRRGERLGEGVPQLLRKAVGQFCWAERVAPAGRAWARARRGQGSGCVGTGKRWGSASTGVSERG